MDGALVITRGTDGNMIERFSAVDMEFQKVREHAQNTYSMLKASKACAREDLFERFKDRIVQLKLKMQAKFEECQAIHRDGGKHVILDERERKLFNQKYTMNYMISCIISSRIYATRILQEIEMVCK